MRKFFPWFHWRSKAAAEAIARADLRVRCFDNWYDFDESLSYLTPGGTGVWDGVAFLRDDVPAPDWIGIFNHPGRRPVRITASPNRVFFAIGEPPGERYRPMHLGQGDGTFVLTCDEEVACNRSLPRRAILCPAMARTWQVRRSIDELRRTRVEDKPRSLSWITSNAKRIPGHLYRMDFLERLRGKLEFDLYGRGFRPIADKWPALAPYRYSIAFENTFAPYYFTEKLMDCFVAETMPIYFGSPSIGQFFPPESMLVLDPETPNVAGEIAALVKSDLWLRRKDAILEAKRLVLEEYNLFARLARFVKEQSAPPAPAVPMTITPVSC